MADNVTIPASGSGSATPVIKTDQLADNSHVQYVKLMDGTADSTAVIEGTAANGLEVDVTRLPALVAGSANIGDVDVASIAAGNNNIGDVDVASIAAGDNNIGNVDIVTVPAPLSSTGGGTEAAALRVTLANDSTGLVSVDDNGASLTVDVGTALPAGSNAIGKLAANSGVDIGDVDILSIAAGNNNIGDVDVASVVPGTGATNLGKAEDAGHSSGDVGVMALAIRDDTIGPSSGSEGDYEPLHTDATGALWTDPQGNVAHDAADAGNPIKVGAIAKSAEQTAVANNDRVNLVADLVGKLIALPYANPENFVKGKTAAITDTTRTAVIAAQGAGVKLYITHIIVTNSHATVGTYVKIEDDTTEIYGGYAAALGGGFSITLPVPLVLTANKALNVTCGTTGSNIYASASGYKGV